MSLEAITQLALEPPLEPDLSGQTREVRCFAEIAGGQIEYHENEPSFEGWCSQAVVCEIELSLLTDESGNLWPDIDSGIIYRSCKLWDGVSETWLDYITIFGEENCKLLKSLVCMDISTQQGETFIFD